MAPRTASHTPTLLIVVRHAHRDKSEGRDSDNGVSGKGKKQAAKILEHFKKEFPSLSPAKVRFLSSPKKRCVETVQPIAEWMKAKVHTSHLLDEGPELEDRARKFLSDWKREGTGVTVICSHGDWIPLFLELATGVPTDLAKGGWAQLESVDGRLVITRLIQEF
jgi:broad specificity phosphatase PhoE